MGASLAKVIAGREWAGLVGPVARNLMTFMAIRAQDRDKPPVYWGGRDELAIVVHGDLSDDPVKRANQYRYVSRLLRELKAAGGIIPTNVAIRGITRAAYEIQVMPWSVVDKSSTSKAAPTNAPSGQNVHIGVHDLSTAQAATCTNRPQIVDDLTIPRTTEDLFKREDLVGRNIDHPSSSPHLGARAIPENDMDLCTICGRDEPEHLRRTIRGAHRFTTARAAAR